MTVKQRKWILKKVSVLIEKYNSIDIPTDEQLRQLILEADGISELSKRNDKCIDVLTAMINCFDGNAEEV